MRDEPGEMGNKWGEHAAGPAHCLREKITPGVRRAWGSQNSQERCQKHQNTPGGEKEDCSKLQSVQWSLKAHIHLHGQKHPHGSKAALTPDQGEEPICTHHTAKEPRGSGLVFRVSSWKVNNIIGLKGSPASPILIVRLGVGGRGHSTSWLPVTSLNHRNKAGVDCGPQKKWSSRCLGSI